jgi:hypothetical protein
VNGAGATAPVDALAAPGTDVVVIAPPSGTPGIELDVVVLVDVVVVSAARWSLVGGRIVLPSSVSHAATPTTRPVASRVSRAVGGRRSTPGERR